MNIALTRDNKLAAFWTLSFAYGFSSLCYIANFYSLEMFFSFPAIFFALVLLAPLFGSLWISLTAIFCKGIGRLLGGVATLADLRSAVVRSKEPTLILLALWTVFIACGPSTAFMHQVSNGSAVAIIVISLLVNFWSFGILLKSLQTVQGFGFIRALCNVLLVYFLSFCLFTSTLFLTRYIYISTF